MLKERIRLGMRLALRSLRSEIRLAMLDRKGRVVAHRRYPGQGYKLHLGCGDKIKDGWINIDSSQKGDLSLDLREPLPFRDKSCSIVYSEHFLEHVDYPEPTLGLLKECWRVLDDGGVISIGVPDAGTALLRYADGDEAFFARESELFHPSWCTTKMEHINYTFRQGTQHRFAYDFETLAKVLSQSGFVEISQRSHDSNLDSRDPTGLYVVGYKRFSPRLQS